MEYKKNNLFAFLWKTNFRTIYIFFIFITFFVFSIDVSQGAGNDLYTKLLIHGDGTGNAFTDSSSGNKSITAHGNATQSSTQSKFGGKSMYFDGSGDYLSTSDNTDWNFGTDNFTIDCWVYFSASSTSQGIVSSMPSDPYVDLPNANFCL